MSCCINITLASYPVVHNSVTLFLVQTSNFLAIFLKIHPLLLAALAYNFESGSAFAFGSLLSSFAMLRNLDHLLQHHLVLYLESPAPMQIVGWVYSPILQQLGEIFCHLHCSFFCICMYYVLLIHL